MVAIKYQCLQFEKIIHYQCPTYILVKTFLLVHLHLRVTSLRFFDAGGGLPSSNCFFRDREVLVAVVSGMAISSISQTIPVQTVLSLYLYSYLIVSSFLSSSRLSVLPTTFSPFISMMLSSFSYQYSPSYSSQSLPWHKTRTYRALGLDLEPASISTQRQIHY